MSYTITAEKLLEGVEKTQIAPTVKSWILL